MYNLSFFLFAWERLFWQFLSFGFAWQQLICNAVAFPHNKPAVPGQAIPGTGSNRKTEQIIFSYKKKGNRFFSCAKIQIFLQRLVFCQRSLFRHCWMHAQQYEMKRTQA